MMSILILVLAMLFPVPAMADEELAALPSARHRAEQLFLQDRPSDAVPEFQQAIREEPNRVNLYFQLAVVYEQLDRSSDAESVLRQGLDRNPEHAHVFLHNMAIQRIRRGDRPGAEELLLNSVERNPDFASPWRNLGNLSVEAGDFVLAVERYERYLETAPNSPARPSVEQMISHLNALIVAEQERIEAEERARAEEERRRRELEEAAARRRQELQEAVRRSLEESRREAERFGGGEEDFETVEDDFDIFD